MAEKLMDIKLNISNIKMLTLNNDKFLQEIQRHGKQSAGELCKALGSMIG